MSFPLVLLIVFTNYTGDAAKLFSDWYEKKICEEILAGSNVTNIGNYNERLLQKELITKSEFCPEVLVLGSSRVMQINSTHVRESLFNCGVSGASVEDMFAIVELFEKRNCVPKNLIIGLDPWTLNENNEQQRWKFLEPEYRSLATRIGLENNKSEDGFNSGKFDWSLYLQLISLSYFQESFATVFFKENQPYPSKQRYNDNFTKLSDGSVTYGKEYRTVSRAILAERNFEYLTGKVYSVENFHALSPTIKNKLEGLIGYLLNKRCRILLFLSPYHPDIFNKIKSNSKYRMVLESERYFTELARIKDLPIVGSFDPARIGLDESYFYDGMHINDEGVRIVFGTEESMSSRSWYQ